MKKYNNREDGFTLIELLIVVLIIGILAAIAIPVYIGIQNQAKHSAVKADVNSGVSNVQVAITEGNLTVPTTASVTPISGYSDSAARSDGAQVVTTPLGGGDFQVQGTGLDGYSYTYDSRTGQFSESSNIVAGGGASPTAAAALYTLTAETGDPTNSQWTFSNASFSSTTAAQGSRSVYITGFASLTSLNLPVGKSFTVTAYMYNVDSPATSKGVNMVLYSDASTVATTLRTQVSGSWQPISATFTTTGAGAKINIGSYFSGSGYIDQIVITQNN